MSEPIEKTPRRSIFISALGTWAGLGFGLGLLVTAVLAVTTILTNIAPPERVITTLEKRVTSDLIGLVPGTLTVTENGSSLELHTFSLTDSKPVKVSYARAVDGSLLRLVDESRVERLGRCREVRFSLDWPMLSVTLSDEYGRSVLRQTIERWRRAE